MNCCDTQGHCTQGQDCFWRQLGNKQNPTRAARIESSSCAPEGGNVWFAEPEPSIVWPVTREDKALVLLARVLVGAIFMVSIVSIFMLAGYVLGRWIA